MRRSRGIRRRNPKRAARLFAEDFGSKEYVEYLHALPCAICEVYGWTEAAHVVSRGAGGKVGDLIPLCGSRHGVLGCHQKFDLYYPEARADQYRLRALAKSLRRAWLEQEEEE